jgi:hypothetical protein
LRRIGDRFPADRAGRRRLTAAVAGGDKEMTDQVRRLAEVLSGPVDA